MSSTLAVHARLKVHPGKRDELLDLLRPIAQKAYEDPDTLAFFAAIPAQGDDGTLVALFEIYKDEASRKAHEALPEVDTLRKAAPTLFSERPFSLLTKPFGKSFVRPDISTEAADAGLTILIRMTWADGTDMAQVKSNFTNLIEYCEAEEPQTFGYHYSTSEEAPNTLFAFEQFESVPFCMETHMKTEQFVKTTSYASDAMTPDPLFAKRVFGFTKK